MTTVPSAEPNAEPSAAPEVKAVPETVTAAFDEFMEAFEAFKDVNDRRLGEIEQKLTADVVTRDKMDLVFAEQEGDAFIRGDGVNKPKGFLSYTTVADSSWTWGNIGYVATGSAGAWKTSGPSDTLVDLVYALKAGHRQNGTFMMNRKTQGDIRKFKDADGNYLWRPPASAGQPASLMGYATVAVTEKTGEGSARVLNRNVVTAGTDWQASLDELQALCPNLQRVALVVSWFGTDLRAGQCRIVPGVEVTQRRDERSPWVVAGVSRAEAHLVSQDGGPAYGGTPSDASVMQAIVDLKARGLKIYLYPFVMMDIPPGNGLPDPYGGEDQAAYPWRGRITCFPVSDDRTAAVADQIAAFTDGAEGYRGRAALVGKPGA